ncbi:MAG: hypothetical protein JNM63_04770, partial [Spirochaetia bacterium]|nr:hypothetical protein [Spirochaetia bacterium]
GKKVNNITRQGCHRRVKENEFPYKNTEVESVFIVGDFAVRSWENRDFSIAKKSASALPLADITTNGYPFYAGNCAYTSSFTLTEKFSKVRLEFSEVHAPSIRAKVNGKNAGAVLWDPFTLDVTSLVKPGANEIEIAFPTDLFNLMGPNTAPLGLPEGVSPGTFRFDAPWSRELLLLRRGIGGVRLVLE